MLYVSSSSNRANHGDGSHDRGFPLSPHTPAVAPGTVPGSPARQSLAEAHTRLQAGVAISPSCPAQNVHRPRWRWKLLCCILRLSGAAETDLEKQ